MGDVGASLDDRPSESVVASSQGSQGELLDISNSVVRVPEAATTANRPAEVNRPRLCDEEPDLALEICAEEEENLHVVLAMNEAMSDLLEDMITKAEESLRDNLDKQKQLEEKKKAFNANAALVKRKIPVVTFMPPYFKDNFNMCPPQNIEMKRKFASMTYDPLVKEDRRWTPADLRALHRSVRSNLMENRLMPLYGQRDIILDKIRAADSMTTEQEMAEWKHKLDGINRKIEFEKKVPDQTLFTGDYSKIDWAAIAMTHFKGYRSPVSLQLKWCNEVAPQWNKEPWTATEVKKLNELRGSHDFLSWTLVAEKLGTKRTAWQCFEKFKSGISTEMVKREWTQTEDERLVQLVESLQLNGVVQWDKVTYHMAGRTRQQCRTRFLRTLDKTIKHGRWTDEEDLLLMCSIGRYGAKDWRRIAKGVPGRSDGQCRERWVNVLDRNNRTEEWSMEEDEKLLYGVNMFGKGQWAKISSVLPGRNQRVCKARFRSLMTTKMRICATQLSQIRDAQANRRGGGRSHLKKRSEHTFKEFNKLVGADDETGERFCDGARSVAEADTYRYKRVDPEERRVVEEGMQDIAKKYEGGTEIRRRNRNRDRDIMHDTDTEELLNGIEASGRIAALRQQSWLPVEFDPEVSEEQKRQRLTEALCQVVGKQDQMRSIATQEAYASQAKTAVTEKLRRLLVDATESRVQRAMGAMGDAGMEEDDQPSTSKAAAAKDRQRSLEARMRREMQCAADAAANDMLHPTAVTTHAAELLVEELPRIMQIATPLLSSNWSGERLGSMEEVLARLEDSLRHHQEFVELRELLRCLLVEPLMLIYSLEDDERKEQFLTEEFNRVRGMLMGDVEMGRVVERVPPRNKKAPTLKTPKSLKAAVAPKSAKGGRSNKKQKREGSDSEHEEDPMEGLPPANTTVWDDIDEEELPVDWEEEEEEEPAAKTPSGRTSRAKKAATPPTTRRKAATMGGVVKEEATKGKDPPAKKGRTTRNSMSRSPMRELELELAEKPKKGRTTRNSMARELSEAVEGAEGDKREKPKRGKGRSSKSKTPAVDEDGHQEVAEGGDQSMPTEKTTVAGEMDAAEDTVEDQENEDAPADDAVNGQEGGGDGGEDTVSAKKDTV